MFEQAEIKINRIKAKNAGAFGLLGKAFENTEALAAASPRLVSAMEARVEKKAIYETLSTLGKHCRTHGFDPTRTFQHVAQIDPEIWQVILGMFARYDEETGEFMDDGLLYKYDPAAGCVRLNKDFFYALLSYLTACGYDCDMRNKVKLT